MASQEASIIVDHEQRHKGNGMSYKYLLMRTDRPLSSGYAKMIFSRALCLTSRSLSFAARRTWAILVLFTLVATIPQHPATAAWIQTNGPEGGIITTIEIDPHNPDILYAAGHGGSVFKSMDNGDSWKMLTPFVHPGWVISDIIIPPQDNGTIYALSGNLFKTVDGGQAWRSFLEGLSPTSVTMDSSNPQRLAVGTRGGLVLLTTDGGENWTDISGNLPGERIADIAFGAANELWVGTVNNGNGRLYHTRNLGVSWEKVDLGQRAATDILSLFVDREDKKVVYVGLSDSNNEVFNGTLDDYLFKTIDGGDSWSSLHLPGLMDTMINVIGAAPGDSVFYVGTGGYVYKSLDGGKTWTWISLPGHNGEVSDIAVDSRDHAIVYIPRRSHGIAKSMDAGESWAILDRGLHNTHVSLLAMPNTPGTKTLYASTVSGEGTFKTTNRGQSWRNVTGDMHPWADELVVSPHSPESVWEVADVGNVYVSENGGKKWNAIVTTTGASTGFRFGSVYAFASAPSDQTIMYALKNGFGIFKSTNNGMVWRFLHHSEIDYTYSLAVHPQNPNVVYSGYSPKPFQDWAMIRRTRDGGDTWDTSLKIPGSKGITSVAIDPGNPATIYAGSTGEGGELWVSRNAGDSWSKLNEYFTFTNIHAMAVHPSKPDVAYAGVWGGGTYSTADGGKTWARLANDPTISASAILIDPHLPDLMYLADRTAPRIYRSEDGGKSWKCYFDAGTNYYRVMTAILAPSAPNVMYASLFTYGGPMAGEVFRIENGVALNVTGGLPRLPVALAVDPLHENVVYAVLHGSGVYKTENGGLTWVELSGSESGLPQNPTFGFNGLIIAPNDNKLLYLLGGCDVDVGLEHSGADLSVMQTVYKSSDAGQTWVNMNDGMLGSSSGSIKGLAVSPQDPDLLYLGTAKGAFRSIDGGKSWSSVSTGLKFRNTAGVALNADGTRLYAPTLGGGVFSGTVNPTTREVVWEKASRLKATVYQVQVAVHPSKPKILYAGAYPGGIFKSSDGGTHWMECNFGMASFSIDDPNRQGYYAFAMAPSKPDVLSLGLYGVGVYKSIDGAGTWQPMHGTDRKMRGKPITSLAVDPNNPDMVYVATENGVFCTVDGGENWNGFNSGLECLDVRVISLGSGGGLYAGTKGYELFTYDRVADSWKQMTGFRNYGTFWPIWNDRPLYQYTSLLFHPTLSNTIYMGTFPAGVFKSQDGGKTWRERTVGWTNDGVFYLVFHPKNPKVIYAGTYNGVSVSKDNGMHWKKIDKGWPAEQWVFSIDFDPRNPKIMYACSKNGENEGTGREGFHGTVMKSTNGGASWFPIVNGLNVNQELYKIIADKVRPGTLYLATSGEGVWISRDAGLHWKPWNEGLTNLVAGTNGNNVTNAMICSPDWKHIFFGTAGSGVFRRSLPAQ